MNFSYLLSLIITAFACFAGAENGIHLESIMPGIAKALSKLSTPNQEEFEKNRAEIFAVAKDQMTKVSSLLMEVPDFFAVDLNQILEPHGFAVNDTFISKRDGNLHRRSFWSFLKDVINTTLVAIAVISTVITAVQPEFAGVAAAAYALHKYIEGGDLF